MVVKNGCGDYVVIFFDGERIIILEDDVDEVVYNLIFLMLIGMFDELLFDEIVDFFIYLGVVRKLCVVW